MTEIIILKFIAKNLSDSTKRQNYFKTYLSFNNKLAVTSPLVSCRSSISWSAQPAIKHLQYWNEAKRSTHAE